jgi:hypothetical protein
MACGPTVDCWATSPVSKQFWTFLGIGLAVVAIAIVFTLVGTKGSHLDLEGKILKVRVLSLNPNASIVVVDFRAKNPSDIGFLVKNVTMTLEPGSGEPVDGAPISKYDVENVFKYEKLLGSKYNDVLSIRVERGGNRVAQIDQAADSGHGRRAGGDRRKEINPA